MLAAIKGRPWQGGFNLDDKENITRRREEIKLAAYLEAGFPGLGARALEEMPEAAGAWLEDCERSEAAIQKARRLARRRRWQGWIYYA